MNAVSSPQPGAHPAQAQNTVGRISHTNAAEIAQAVLEGFDKHYRLFRQASREARQLFEDGNWHGVQLAVRERIRFYDERVAEAVARLRREFNTDALHDSVWQHIKLHYIGLLINHKQPELAETFFNSVSCQILNRIYYHNDFMFVRPAISTEHIESDPPSYRSYYPVQGGLRATFRQIAADFGFKRPFADFERDFRYLLHAVRERFPRPFVAEANHQIQMLSAPFFRNKGAYLVGKIINGNHDYPFSVAMLHDANGKLYLDTILLERSQLEVLFSFARAYFMVDMEVPSAYVRFLQTLLPDKPVAEIYTMLGLQKHGKTLFYREFLHHLKHSSDNFIVAPGIRGMVMAVFTLPSYPYVFKVIRDVISPPKEVTKEKVREQYQLVKQHDRVGRMADTLEFSNVALPRARFGAELLEELRTLASSEIEEEGDTLIIKHVYIERRMVPLNICLDGADDERLRHCIFDFGNAIKQLATANIFPGDMLFKNFGVTRHDRIVFYDYDEISYMTGCNFRRVPQAQTPEQELAAEPWYTVGPHDIFPEEFSHFWFGTPQIREHFLTYHAYLLDPKFWQDTQRKIAAGHIEDVFPYGEKARFHRRFGKPATQSGMSQ